jgi:hypothetical protein
MGVRTIFGITVRIEIGTGVRLTSEYALRRVATLVSSASAGCDIEWGIGPYAIAYWGFTFRCSLNPIKPLEATNFWTPESQPVSLIAF